MCSEIHNLTKTSFYNKDKDVFPFLDLYTEASLRILVQKIQL